MQCLSLSAGATDTREDREAMAQYEKHGKRSHLAPHGSAVRRRCTIERTKQHDRLSNFAHTAFWELAR